MRYLVVSKEREGAKEVTISNNLFAIGTVEGVHPRQINKEKPESVSLEQIVEAVRRQEHIEEFEVKAYSEKPKLEDLQKFDDENKTNRTLAWELLLETEQKQDEHVKDMIIKGFANEHNIDTWSDQKNIRAYYQDIRANTAH